MQGVRIVKIPPVKADDPRGPTWEWKFSNGNGDNKQITICVRKAGAVGTHFHKGHDKSKSPERLFLISGKIRMTFSPVPLPGQEDLPPREEVIIEAGTEIVIEPLIIHKTEVLEDATIIEYRITHFHPLNPDTFPAQL